MNRLKITVLIALLASLLLILVLKPPEKAEVSADQTLQVFASQLHGGCYLATRSICKLKVDPFTINTSASLVNFKLQANGHTIYDFSTDQSNPPFGNYTPSLVKGDFAAQCGQTYVMKVIAADSSAPTSYYNLGSTRSITCPQGTYDLFMPSIAR